MGDTPSLPNSKIEAEDRHANFYDARVNLQELIDRHQRGDANEEQRLWALLSLEIWHRTCVHNAGAGPTLIPGTGPPVLGSPTMRTGVTR
jgi:hypothetical protein